MKKKPKFHKIQIRNRKGSEGMLTVGANTEILLDGKRLGGAKSLRFEVNSRETSRVYIELYAEVEVEANVKLKKSKEKTNLVTSQGKAVARYNLSSYSPVATDFEKK